MQNEKFFLSASNPTATVDQRELEKLALQITETDTYKAGRIQVAQLFRAVLGDDPEQQDWDMFEDAMDEFAFIYALKATNCDSNYPRVLSAIYRPEIEWFGHKMPACRVSGDAPDNHYAMFPVDDKATFKITGKRFEPAPAHVTWQFNTDSFFSISPGYVHSDDIEYNEDGSYEVIMGPEKPNGRKNHFQIPQRTRFVFVRESRADWTQVPGAMQVERLGEPAAPPRSLEQMAEHAVWMMREDVPKDYWFIQLSRHVPVNTMPVPKVTGAISGMHLQLTSLGNLRIEEDEAYVVTVGSGNAQFRDFVLMDVWYRSLDYHKRQSCMNNAQGILNADGSTTYVVSHRDPGIHNWLDAGGIRNLSPVHRWQGLPLDEGNAPFIDGKLVKFDELEQHLPREIQRVSPEQRQRQLEQRKREFNLRWIDS